MDQPKVERMLRLMKLMSGPVNYSVNELAEKLDTSYRSIYRYIDTFKNAGFVVERVGAGSVYKLLSAPEELPDFNKLVYFSEEEAWLVNSLIDRLDPTNKLKVNLKQKLSVIYDSTRMADWIDNKSNAANIQQLGKAIQLGRQAVLKDYESGHSHSVRDRMVEPFAFTVNQIEVWCYDLEDGANKLFKVSRIGEVEVLDKLWEKASKHRKNGLDVFGMSGTEPQRVRLRMSVLAKNLLLEEYPLAERDVRRDGDGWLLDTEVYNLKGVCRFYVGLASDCTIEAPESLKEYVREYVRENLL